MISVGIDVSKRKSTAAIVSVQGEVLHSPFDFEHTIFGIQKLLDKISTYPQDQVRFVLEATGLYHQGLLSALISKGYFVHVANPLLIKKYFDATMRKGKTDKKDALKLSSYGIDKWFRLEQYSEQERTRHDLQFLHRQYSQHIAIKTKAKVQLKNLIEISFPGLEKILKDYYSALLLDVYEKYPSAALVLQKGEKRFSKDMIKMAEKKGHRTRTGAQLAQKVYQTASACVACEPTLDYLKLSVKHCIAVLRCSEEATEAIITQMSELAKTLPEYEVVRNMSGVGDKLAPRLIAEIGDVRRFKNAKSLVAFAGLDSPPYQSGQFEGTRRHISKRGSRYLRKCGYEVMMSLKKIKPKTDNAVYEYILKKEKEGKLKSVAKIAGLNKFLRIYYARVMEVYSN